MGTDNEEYGCKESLDPLLPMRISPPIWRAQMLDLDRLILTYPTRSLDKNNWLNGLQNCSSALASIC